MITTAVLFSISLYFSTGETLPTKVVDTTSGPVRGLAISLPNNKTVLRYLGIPYAKAKRFEYPQESKWLHVLDAQNHGKACPQPGSTLGVQSLEETSEDCLNLDIHVPQSSTTKLPVVMFVGGVFYAFGRAGKHFDGLSVATRGNYIAVTLNYRLGILGFLSTGTRLIRGNYGLADQVEALRWLHRNIQRFGGNPNDITLVGHSSGAMSVGLLLVTPQAQGFFRHVILMSGSPLSLTAMVTQATAAQRARQIGEQLKCQKFSNLKECLDTKSVQDIITAQKAFHNTPISSPFSPVVDGNFLPDLPEKLLKTTKLKVESVMVGVVKDDGTIFVSPRLPGVTNDQPSVTNGINQSTFLRIVNTNKWTQTLTGNDVINHQYTKLDDPSNPEKSRQLVDLFSDSAFNAPATKFADVISKLGVPTYFYYLESQNSSLVKLPTIQNRHYIGHGYDVRLLFGALTLNESMRKNKDKENAAQKGFKMWMDFVRTGNPTPPSSHISPHWPRYSANGYYLAMGTNVTVKFKFRSGFMAFWNALLPASNAQSLVDSENPTTTSSHGNNKGCYNEKDKTKKALTAVVAVMAIVIIIMLSIIVYQTRMLSKRNDLNSQQDG